MATVNSKTEGAAVCAAVCAEDAQAATPAGTLESSSAARALQLNTRAWALKRADPERARALSEEARSCSQDPKGLAYSLLTLAFCAVDTLEFAAARTFIEAGMRAAEKADAPYAQARADLISGYLLTRLADFDAALEAHARSSARFISLGDALGEATVQMYVAGIYIDRGEFALARESLAPSMKVFEQLGDTEGSAQGLLMHAIIELYDGNYTGGLRANLEALRLKEALGDVRGQVFVLNNLGGYHVSSGDWEGALGYYLDGLKRLETLRNPPARSMLLVNTAEVYSELGDSDKAVRYALEGLAIDEALGRRRDQVDTLEILGRIYLRAGDDSAAQTHLERALALSEAIGELDSRVLILCKLAGLRHRRGDLTGAQTLYQQGLELALCNQNRLVETDIRLGLGKLLSLQGNTAAAQGELLRALELSQTLGLKRATIEVHEAFSKLFEGMGHFAEALTHLKEGRALDKQLSGERSSDRSQRLAAQFELEKLSRDAEIERLKSVELARANEALHAINEENAALLKQLREQAVKLEQQTREDALTGLHNRRHLEGELQAAFVSARRYRHPLSAVLIDIDDFKVVNDTLSHQIGDEVLRAVAKIFTRFVRSVDVVARYGGEEFALVLPRTDASGACALCERIRNAVASYPWSELHPDLQVTISVGVSDDLRVKDHEKLLALADGKLYEAKRAGKNRVAF